MQKFYILTFLRSECILELTACQEWQYFSFLEMYKMCLLQLIKPTTETVESSNKKKKKNLLKNKIFWLTILGSFCFVCFYYKTQLRNKETPIWDTSSVPQYPV